MTRTPFGRLVAAATLVGSLGLAATGAQAQTRWQADHPYRAADNARLRHQNARITAAVRDGQISYAQARALRRDDHAIRREERADAAVNGSHLTRADQRAIRQQENANSRAIYAGRHY